MKSYHEKKLGKKDKPKEICKVLKSLCLNSVKTMKSKIYLKKNCIIQFEPLKMQILSKGSTCMSRKPPRKLPKTPKKLLIKQSKATTARLHAT